MTNYLVQHADSGTQHITPTLDGYSDPDWLLVGEVPEGLNPEYAVEQDGLVVENLPLARQRKWEVIKAERGARVSSAPTLWGTFQADDLSLSYMNGKVARLSRPEDTSVTVTWRLADNGFAVLSKADFIAAAVAVADYIEEQLGLSWQLQAAIDAAQTIEDIEAIGWPDAPTA